MQCFDCSEWLSLRLDGLIEREQSARLQEHLASCEACRAEWEAMQGVSSVLQAASVVAPPLNFTANVALRLQQRQARRRRVRGGIGLMVGSVGLWGLAAAILALLFLTVWQPLVRLFWVDVMLPSARNVASIALVLGRALQAVIRELFSHPRWLLLPGYAMAAFGLIGLWTRVAIWPRRRAVRVNS
jgi:predicted anti-sigma-YlaC factor YlaD